MPLSTEATQVPTTATPASTGEAKSLDFIYEQLVAGVGHELVTDTNADELARRAERDGHPVLATELREWKSPC